jgi:hypothetical protein
MCSAAIAAEEVTRSLGLGETLNDIVSDRGLVHVAGEIRRIGGPVSSATIGQMLYLGKHRVSGELSAAESVVFDIFRHTLGALDAHAKAEKARADREAAERNRPAPHHTPVEETTLRRGRGPLDTVF